MQLQNLIAVALAAVVSTVSAAPSAVPELKARSGFDAGFDLAKRGAFEDEWRHHRRAMAAPLTKKSNSGAQKQKSTRHRRRGICRTSSSSEEAPATTAPVETAPADTPEPEPVPTTTEQQEEPAPTPEPTSDSGNNSGGSAPNALAQEYLDAHNNARANHGAPAMSWSDELASAAQRWADGCVWQHSGGSLGPYGENLAAGTGGMTASGAVAAWMEEAPDYNPSNPQASHFTQVVWKASTELGCAVANCPGGTIFDGSYGSSQYHVCEYRAQGNVVGRYAENVQA